MAEQTIVIHINGFWRDQYKGDLRETAGIYFVYEANFNEALQTVDLLQLIYIGDADNIRDCILDSELRSEWQKHLAPGNELCYAFAHVDRFSRKRVKAAYVFTHKPPANADAEEPFHYDKTILVSTGKTALVNPVITVRSNAPFHKEQLKSRLRNEMIPVRSVHVFNSSSAGRRFAIGE